MNINVIPFTSDHAYEIMERNIKEGRFMDIPDNLNDILSLWEHGGPGYTLVVEGAMVASAGVFIISPHRGEESVGARRIGSPNDIDRFIPESGS